MHFSSVTPETLPRLDQALRALSADLGDQHKARQETLAAALFGHPPACYGILATRGQDTLGASVFSPVMSTVTGAPGAYISDLWIAPQERGRGLGPKLLHAVAEQSKNLWQASFLKLVSYRENARAAAFYARLGFVPQDAQTTLVLSGDNLNLLKEKS